MYGGQSSSLSVARCWRSLSQATEACDPLAQIEALNNLSESLALASGQKNISHSFLLSKQCQRLVS